MSNEPHGSPSDTSQPATQGRFAAFFDKKLPQQERRPGLPAAGAVPAGDPARPESPTPKVGGSTEDFFASKLPQSQSPDLLPPTPPSSQVRRESESRFHEQLTQPMMAPTDSGLVASRESTHSADAWAASQAMSADRSDATVYDPNQESDVRRRHEQRERSFEPGAGLCLGDFELVKELGKGGMGVVWLATQRSLDRPVAVKLLPSNFATQSQFVERFEREAKSAANLVHPNVIQIYAFGIERGTPYFAMEFVRGEDLQQRLARQGRRPLNEIVDLMIGVASALAAAGDIGIVHRDIKPSNVMIDAKGNIKVMDFGLAKATSMASSSLTQSGLIMGTPKYMSPEQARGDEVDQRSDIYSLGVVFYELLTGQLPFRSDTPAGLIFKHVYEAPPPLKAQNPDVPMFLEEVVLRMLAKDPEARYATAHELLVDLREFQENKAYYIAGGARRSGEEGYLASDGRSGSGSFQERPTEISPPPTTGTVNVTVKSGSGLATAFIAILLMAVAGAVAWSGHRMGHWTIPYLPPAEKQPNGNIGTDAPQPVKDPKPPVETPTKIDVVFLKPLPKGLRGEWNVFPDKAYGVLNPGTPVSVLPGAYIARFSKAGYEPLLVAFEAKSSGEPRSLDGDKPLSELDLLAMLRPTAALRDAYEAGLRALQAERWAEAIQVMEPVSQLDPNFALEGKPKFSQVLADARQKLAAEEERNRRSEEALSAAKAAFEKKLWSESLARIAEVDSTWPRYAEAQKLDGELKARQAALAAQRDEASEALAMGELDRASQLILGVVADDPAALDAVKDADRALSESIARGRELRTRAFSRIEAGLSAHEAASYVEAQKAFVEADEAFTEYLKIAPKDGKAEARRSEAREKIERSASVGELVAKLQAAMKAADHASTLEAADAVLRKVPQNEMALKARKDAEQSLREAAVRDLLKRLDQALLANKAEAALSIFVDPSQARKDLEDFARVARWTRSEHKLKALVADGPRWRASVDWSFSVEFPDWKESSSGSRKQSLVLESSGGLRNFKLVKIESR